MILGAAPLDPPPHHLATVTAPLRPWAAYALLLAVAGQQLAGVVGLLPGASGAKFAVRAANEFPSYAGPTVIAFTVLAVALVSFGAQPMAAARRVATWALVELLVGGVFGVFFGVVVGVYGLTSYARNGTILGVQALFTRLGLLLVLAVSAAFVAKIRTTLAGAPATARPAATPPSTPHSQPAAGGPTPPTPGMNPFDQATTAFAPTGGSTRPEPVTPLRPPPPLTAPAVPEAAPSVYAPPAAETGIFTTASDSGEFATASDDATLRRLSAGDDPASTVYDHRPPLVVPGWPGPDRTMPLPEHAAETQIIPRITDDARPPTPGPEATQVLPPGERY